MTNAELAAGVIDKVKGELTPIWLGGRQRMMLEKEIAAALDAVTVERDDLGEQLERAAHKHLSTLARVAELEWALKNCYMMARRMLARTELVDPEWTHIGRFCKEAGCKEGGVLRDEQALATRTEEGG